MGKRKARLVINPRGGKNVARLADVLAVLNAGGYKTDVVLKEYGGHTLELAEQAVEDACDLIVSYGGDGTLNQVVNGVLNAEGQSVVGVLPGGTGNLWATEIGIPTDNVIKAALTLLNSEARCVDVGHVTVQDMFVSSGSQQAQHEQGEGKSKKSKARHRRATRTHFLLMAGLGLDAAVMQGVSKPLKYKIKQLAVGLSAVKELPVYRPFPLEVRADDGDLLWQGEALQVVIGNTRLYADVLHITPNAYIDDGRLDVCVITAGNPLGAVQQIFSLLLRHQPDNQTAQYFSGSRLALRVPASVGLQLDGSAVKLKDYLTQEQKQAIKASKSLEKVTIEYAFEALPQSLHVAVPRTYNNTLFREKKSPDKAEEQQAKEHASHPSSSSVPTQFAEREQLAQLREQGFRVNVVGADQEAQNNTYIVAGTITQENTGTVKPVAVAIDGQAAIFKSNGEPLALASIQQLKEGEQILVTGKKNKYGVIQAKNVIT